MLLQTSDAQSGHTARDQNPLTRGGTAGRPDLSGGSTQRAFSRWRDSGDSYRGAFFMPVEAISGYLLRPTSATTVTEASMGLPIVSIDSIDIMIIAHNHNRLSYIDSQQCSRHSIIDSATALTETI